MLNKNPGRSCEHHYVGDAWNTKREICIYCSHTRDTLQTISKRVQEYLLTRVPTHLADRKRHVYRQQH